MANNNFSEDQELLKCIAENDERAFKALFDRYRERLYSYILSITKSREIAEELVLDVFLKLWLGRETIQKIENMDGFLFRIAYNKSIDFLRAASRDKRLVDFIWDKIQLNESASPENILMLREYEAKLREAIELMPPQRKKVYKMSRENGLPHIAIADELMISKNTVANHITEAQHFIRTYLTKNLDLAIIMSVLSQVVKK